MHRSASVNEGIIVAAPAETSLEPLEPAARRLLRAFLGARNPNTLRAYQRDLEDFASFLGAASAEAATELLLRSTGGRANELALGYRDHLAQLGRQPATVNRRLASLRSIVKMGRMLGMCAWTIEVEGLDVVPYRDTHGPGDDNVVAMLAQLKDDAKGIRDRVIVRLLHGSGLRRGEIVSLERAHYDRQRGLYVHGKGRKVREWVSIPQETARAMEAWLEVRGDDPGPIFTSLDGASYGHALTGSAVYAIVRKLGARAGVVTRPHALRHGAITRALEKTRGDVRKVQHFSRHRDVRVLLRYDDVRRDEGGEVAALVSLPDDQTAPSSPRPSGPYWEAFEAWVEERWPGADPMKTTAQALATFVRDQVDRSGSWKALGGLRPWSDDEVVTMKKILGGAPCTRRRTP